MVKVVLRLNDFMLFRGFGDGQTDRWKSGWINEQALVIVESLLRLKIIFHLFPRVPATGRSVALLCWMSWAIMHSLLAIKNDKWEDTNDDNDDCDDIDDKQDSLGYLNKICNQ